MLELNEEDGQLVEPTYYIPILPVLLINGSQGIGTGWSTFIPPHNPRDLAQYILHRLDSDKYDGLEEPLSPWVKGFEGEINLRKDKHGYVTTGKVVRKGKTKLMVEELPVGRWTYQFKDHLISLIEKGKIRSFKEKSSVSKPSYEIVGNREQINKLSRSNLSKSLKLSTPLLTSNMHAFDGNGEMRKYEKAEEMLEEFIDLRLDLYDERKGRRVRELEFEVERMSSKRRFIELVVGGEIQLLSGTLSHSDLERTVEEKFGNELRSEEELLRMKRKIDGELKRNHNKDVEEMSLEGNKRYSYLFDQPLSHLTQDKMSELSQDEEKRKEELTSTLNLTKESMWEQELNQFLGKWKSK